MPSGVACLGSHRPCMETGQRREAVTLLCKVGQRQKYREQGPALAHPLPGVCPCVWRKWSISRSDVTHFAAPPTRLAINSGGSGQKGPERWVLPCSGCRRPKVGEGRIYMCLVPVRCHITSSSDHNYGRRRQSRVPAGLGTYTIFTNIGNRHPVRHRGSYLRHNSSRGEKVLMRSHLRGPARR